MIFRGLLVVLILAFYGASVQAIDEAKLANSFKKGFEDLILTGNRSADLEEALKDLQFPGIFRANHQKGLKDDLICLACNVAIDVLITLHRLHLPGETLAEGVITLCSLLNIEEPHVCRGTITVHTDTLIYIMDNRQGLTGARVCNVLLQSMGCKDDNAEDWVIEIPDELPGTPKVANKNILAGESVKVLQLTDIHFDPNYAPGSNADCKEPLCCQSGSTPTTKEGAAGYWGDYRGCDTPWTVLTDSLTHIVTKHKNIDFVYYTGDIIDHKVWETNIEKNSKIMTDVLNQFRAVFGSVPVYPILGNHEPHPVNAFSNDGIDGPEISTQWVFDLAVQQWSWLDEDTHETISKGGYYTTFNSKGGYRIVALNSNVCFTYNWWLIYDDKDPFGQLEWLVKILQEAEDKGEKVHILSHVPSADGTCWKPWAREYSRIVKRFRNTIAAQFNGHTHKKENTIFFGSDDLEEPVSVAFNGGSLTTYTDVNPNYVIYHVEPVTAEVKDYDLWVYNVTEANEMPELGPQWYKLYSFLDAYKIPSLRPADMADLAKSLTENPGLREQYHRYKYRDATPALEWECDDDCHLANICYMVTSHHGQDAHCNEIKKLWEAANTNPPA